MVDAATGWFMPSLGYTTNGATPTSTGGTLIASGGSAIVPAGGATLKAMAFKSGATNSAVASGVFSVAAAVATPTFNPAAGAYRASDYPKTIRIATGTAVANIRYTTNGATPSTSTGTLIAASSGDASVPGGATLKAIAFKSGWSNSGVASGVFLIAVAPVIFSDPGDVYPSTKYVTMRSATSGATIFYTSSTSGYPSAPTHSGATETGSTFKYTGPASVKPGTYKYFKAVGYKSGMADSVVTSWFAENTNPGSPLAPQPAIEGAAEATVVEADGAAAPEPAAPTQGQAVPTQEMAAPAQEPAAPSEAAAVAAATPPPRRTVTYTLDALNRKSMTDNGVVTNYTYTGNDLNQFTTVGSQSPAYDANFHLSSYAGWSYVYDADGRLASATASGQSAQFVYDGLGRCVKRTINGTITLFTYDGWQPIVEWDGAGALVATNVYGAGADEILWRYQAGIGTLHYHLDRLGNVQFLLSSTNAGLEKYTYDAFGQPRITDWSGNVRTTSAYGNRFMFTGREWLSTLGIYDYRNRAYHPGLGRFLQTDPIGFAAGDANLYRYCGGNPVNKTDPMGLDTFFGFKFIGTERGVPYWSNYSIAAHQFTYTTHADGSLANAYTWGSNSLTRGTWQDGSTAPQNMAAARSLIRNGGGMRVGDASLDPFVQQAYNILSKEAPHVNGALNGVDNTCQGEAQRLVGLAQQLRTQAVFLASRLIGYDSLNGRPVFYAPAVSDFTPDGEPVYGSNSGAGNSPGTSGGESSGRDTWGLPSIGGTTWGNSAYMPGLLSSLVPIPKKRGR